MRFILKETSSEFGDNVTKLGLDILLKEPLRFENLNLRSCLYPQGMKLLTHAPLGEHHTWSDLYCKAWGHGYPFGRGHASSMTK